MRHGSSNSFQAPLSIGGVILLLGAAAVVLLARNGDLEGAGLVLALLGYYVVAVTADLKKLRGCMDEMLYPRTGSVPRRRTVQLSSLSSDARTIREQLEALEYRRENLEWEVTAATKIRNLPVGAVLENEQHYGEAQRKAEVEGAPPYVASILRLVEQHFRVRAGALVIHDPSGSRVHLQLQRGRRLEAHVQHFVQRYRRANPSGSVVAVDLTGEQHWIGSFQSFGITGVLCGSIPLAGDSTDPILWLGYQSADYLSATERTRLVEFLDRVAGELRLRDRLVALDGKAVAAEQVNKAKGEFIAQVSHDIRSPLNNIKSILNLLHLDGKVEGNEDLLGVALHSCDSMAELVEDILDYSKFSAGRLEPRPSEFSLDELMEQVRREFSVTAKLRGLDLQIATSNPGLSGDAPLIRMDRQHLKRIVTNLVSNALKYTERGGVTLSYSRSAFDRSLVQFTVSDTGRGMNAEQVSQLFVPFTRFDVGGIEGTGLGLTVCKLLAEANGASIAVASSPGTGTTITVQLPAAVAQSKGDNENAVEMGRSAIPDLIRVLVVDDDPDYSRTLSRALGSYAISVVTASSAEEALGLIQSLAPDAIVTDGNMPGGGGRMLVSTLRARGDSTPILLASGSSVSLTDQIRQECVAVLEKPLNIEQVVELIRGAVAARRVNDQAA